MMDLLDFCVIWGLVLTSLSFAATVVLAYIQISRQAKVAQAGVNALQAHALPNLGDVIDVVPKTADILSKATPLGTTAILTIVFFAGSIVSAALDVLSVHH